MWKETPSTVLVGKVYANLYSLKFELNDITYLTQIVLDVKGIG